MNNDSEQNLTRITSRRTYQTVTWKIPNVSSHEHTADHGVQSPSFTFNNASWVLKFYPYGQTEYQSTGYIDIILERLHPRNQLYKIDCNMYIRNAFDMDVKYINRTFEFESGFKQAKVIKYLKSLRDSPEKWQLAPNDTFTLICEMRDVYATEDSETVKPVQGKDSTENGNTRKSGTGELIIGDFKAISCYFKMCELDSATRTKDCPFNSPSFSFANASWKLHPYLQTDQSDKKSFAMVLERCESEIPDHYFSLRISFETPLRKIVYRSFYFNSYYTNGEVILCPLEELNTGKMPRCAHFTLKMSMKENPLKSPGSLFDAAVGNNNTSRSSTVILKNKALQDFKAFYLKREDCDVTIKVNGQEFPAHKAILQARSPVLASAFRCNMKEKATGVIDIKDCDPIYFSDFLCYLYCGEVQGISVENVYSLFVIADKYDVSDLKSNCLEFMEKNVTLDTFCDVIALALQYSENKLIKLATDFFVKNTESIIVSPRWQAFILENPIQGNELFIKAVTSKKE